MVLSLLQRPFILVSGDNDTAINRAILGNVLDLFLGHPHLVRWYTQNKDHDSPKLSAIPIGINLYNLWLDPLQWGAALHYLPCKDYRSRPLQSKCKSARIDCPSSFASGIFRLIELIGKNALIPSIRRFTIFNPSLYLQPKSGRAIAVSICLKPPWGRN